MQLLGAWMMSTPLARAAATARFIAGASSPTRRVAPWHQCWFHMSQMMIAVCAGLHSTSFSVITNGSDEEPITDFPGSRVRACNTSGAFFVSTRVSWAGTANASNKLLPQNARPLLPRQNPRIRGYRPS